jgi:hypothetical protein
MESTSLQKPVKLGDEEVKIKVKPEIVWKNAVGFLLMHILGLYGLYDCILSAKLLTWIYGKYKKKGKAIPLHAMEAHEGRGGIAPTHS